MPDGIIIAVILINQIMAEGKEMWNAGLVQTEGRYGNTEVHLPGMNQELHV